MKSEIMKTATSFFMCLVFLFGSFNPTYAQSADSKADKILKKLKTKYDAYRSIEVNFNLLIDIPEEEELNQTGKIIQQGEMYMVDLPDQALYSNGEVLWVHLKNNEEVQINDLEEGAADMLSPKDMLNMYDSDEFEYAYVGDTNEKGSTLQQIEFKPQDEFSDYSKIRMYISPKDNELAKVIVFSKDGSRYTMTINKFSSNQTYLTDVFTFNMSKYPKIHVEDLRID
jgi:outer membrane lipoprotein-sorting protein